MTRQEHAAQWAEEKQNGPGRADGAVAGPSLVQVAVGHSSTLEALLQNKPNATFWMQPFDNSCI